MRNELRRCKVKSEAFRELYRCEAIRDYVRPVALAYRQMLSVVTRRVQE